VVLFTFFLTSCSTGALNGSLSTNKEIIEKIDEDKMSIDMIRIAKYIYLLIYLPMNFASIWIIENYGLKLCISVGSIIMIGGSAMRFC
jgi:hypothetical protein